MNWRIRIYVLRTKSWTKLVETNLKITHNFSKNKYLWQVSAPFYLTSILKLGKEFDCIVFSLSWATLDRGRRNVLKKLPFDVNSDVKTQSLLLWNQSLTVYPFSEKSEKQIQIILTTKAVSVVVLILWFPITNS